MKMFCEKEFGIEYKAEVSNMGLQGIAVCWNLDKGGAAGRRLVNSIASVSGIFATAVFIEVCDIMHQSTVE